MLWGAADSKLGCFQSRFVDMVLFQTMINSYPEQKVLCFFYPINIEKSFGKFEETWQLTMTTSVIKRYLLIKLSGQLAEEIRAGLEINLQG